jgi:DNA-binding NarL/FixJ family response regulator
VHPQAVTGVNLLTLCRFLPMETGGPLQVRLVNQLPVVRAGLPVLLAPYADRLVVSPDDAAPADVVLLDPARHHCSEAGPPAPSGPVEGSPVVLYTCQSPVELARLLVSESVAGYLHFSVSPEELVGSLEHLVHAPGAGDHARHATPRVHAGEELSAREWEVLQLIAAGDSNQEIADDLFLSINTIKSYIRSGYAKIDVETRSQAVAWVLRH